MIKKLFYTLLFSFFALNSNAQSIGLIGDFNGWGGDVVMNTTDNVNFTLNAYTFTVTGALKFRQDGAWAINWGSTAFPSGTGVQGGDNIPVPAGTYNIALNISNGAYSFTAVTTNWDSIGMYGGFNSWATPSEPMATTDGVTYIKPDFHFTANGVKFIKDNNTTLTWGGTAFPSGTATAGGANIPVTPGYFNVEFNKTTLAYSFIEVPVSIIGSGAVDWNTDIPMSSTDGGVSFTLVGITLQPGAVKFRANFSWATNWGATTFPAGTGTLNGNGNDIPVDTAGIYTVTFNRVTGDYLFTLTQNLFDNFGLTGPFNLGTTALALSTSDGVAYSKKEVYVSAASVKFIKDNDANLTWGGTGMFTGTAVPSTANIPLPVGVYNVDFNKTSLAYSFVPPVVSMTGDGIGGWGVDTDMATTDNGISFTANNVTLTNGSVKFRTNHDWPTSWGSADFPSGTANTGANIPVVAGNYNVTFDRISGLYNFQANTMGLSSIKNRSFSVYPNPSNNVWNFKTNSTEITSISITDISGKMVFSKAISLNEYSVNASEFSNGMYFATVTIGQNTETFKLVKN